MTVILRLSPEQARLLAKVVKESDRALAKHINERVALSAKSTYRRCARAGCRHAASKHASFVDGQTLCGGGIEGDDCPCNGFVANLPHRWRDHVTSIYRDAHLAWYMEAEKVTKGFQTEMTEYREFHPAPTFRNILIDLRQDEVA